MVVSGEICLCFLCVCVLVKIYCFTDVSFWVYIVRAGFSTLYSHWLKIFFQEQIQISSTTWCYFAAAFSVFSSVKLVVKSHCFCGYPGLWWVLQHLLVLAQRNILYPLKRKVFKTSKVSFMFFRVVYQDTIHPRTLFPTTFAAVSSSPRAIRAC